MSDVAVVSPDDAGAARSISVSLSGGGHRAALFALGALLYLADAGKNRAVTSIASVSGGSLTNGHLAQTLDYTAASADEVADWAATPAKRFASKGTLWAAPVTWLYLIALGVVTVAVTVGVWWLPLPTWARALLFVAGLLVVGFVAQLRGAVCGRAFARTLFTPKGRRRPTRLHEIHSTLDHVLCATDLHAGEHVYFSGQFVCAYRFGFGRPGNLPLHTAAQVSAAFPGGFPARWLRKSRHHFQQPQDPAAAKARFLVLADGGVYDNMGDQWAQAVAGRKARWPGLAGMLHEPDELVVVNASAGLEFKSAWTLRLPLVGEFLTLIRDKDVLYDNGTSVRRAALVARFQLAEAEGRGLRGALVHIPQSPYRVARAFENDRTDPQRAARAQAALAALAAAGSTEEEWLGIAEANSRVGTNLSALGTEVSARLVRHAYVLALVNLHVILGYPLVAIPAAERFEKLVS
jgi:predicted acylesterase/phospholipase RssA